MGLSAAYYRYMHQIHFNELGAHPAVIMSLPLLTVSTACRHMCHEHADEDGMDGMRSWSDSGLGGHVHTLHGQHGPWAHVPSADLCSRFTDRMADGGLPVVHVSLVPGELLGLNLGSAPVELHSLAGLCAALLPWVAMLPSHNALSF